MTSRDYTAFVLAALIMFAFISVPARAVVYDPGDGRDPGVAPLPQQSDAEVDRQMSGPKTVAPVGSSESFDNTESPDIQGEDDSQAVRTVTSNSRASRPSRSGSLSTNDESASGKPRHIVAICATLCLMGLACVAAVFAVRRLGSVPAPPDAID